VHVVGTSISVVVPVHNRLDLVRRCLASLPPGIETIVVDDFSTEDVSSVIDTEFPHVRVLRNTTNRGFAATANRGLRVATGEMRVVLNSDARVREGALEALSHPFADPRVGIAGARLFFPDGSHQISAARFPTPARIAVGTFGLHDRFRTRWPGLRLPLEFGMAATDHEYSHEVDWVVGTCLAIRKECLEDLDGFDEGFYMYGEETDLCWRARQRGWRVCYCATSEVEHEGGASLPARGVHPRRILEGEVRFLQRAYGEGVLPRWRAARVVGGSLKILASSIAGLLSVEGRRRARWHWQAVGFALRTSGDVLRQLGTEGVRSSRARFDEPGSAAG
jgi:hypothetical protein